MGLSQAALTRKLGVTRASVNAWEMELSSPTAAYLVEWHGCSTPPRTIYSV
ncbi:helix-turn-helix domain-containing protein [Gemmiger formicilis]